MYEIKLDQNEDCWRGSFTAMASPCEVLMQVDTRDLANSILQAVADEAWRIERKFSRYQSGNIVYEINNSNGKPIRVDAETARLLDFADQLYQMSDGQFDITSGVLRKVWKFDGGNKLPGDDSVQQILKHVGWHQCEWQNYQISLRPGMEVDLGGIGKEYAVDRCLQIARLLSNDGLLINFGGDLACSGERRNKDYWSVGRLITGRDDAVSLFKLFQGAIATSGDANRYLLHAGKRYSHVLNPKTGWPVDEAPHTVSVAATTCIEAGMYATLAMLQGSQAEAFLKLQGVAYWVD